jgi:hypothetical protein
MGIQEFCKKDCPAPRDHVFINADGDFECTSDCSPVPSESRTHGNLASANSIANKRFTYRVGFDYTASGPTNYKTCMEDCTIVTEPNLHGTTGNECL